MHSAKSIFNHKILTFAAVVSFSAQSCSDKSNIGLATNAKVLVDLKDIDSPLIAMPVTSTTATLNWPMNSSGSVDQFFLTISPAEKIAPQPFPAGETQSPLPVINYSSSGDGSAGIAKLKGLTPAKIYTLALVQTLKANIKYRVVGTFKFKTLATDTIAPFPLSFKAQPHDGKISLSWNLNPNATSYNIYSALSPGVTQKSSVVQKILTGNYDFVSTNGVPTYFKITSVNDAGESDPLSPEISSIALAPPANISILSSNSQNILSWVAAIGADDYKIYSSSKTGFSVDTADLVTIKSTLSLTQPLLTNGAPVFYRILSRSQFGSSDLSDEYSGIPLAIPANFSLTLQDQQVNLKWDSVTGATSYNIYWGTSAGITLVSSVLSSSTNSFAHTGRTNGTTYFYRVVAVNSTGKSDLSPEISGVPQVIPGTPVISVAASATQNIISWAAVPVTLSYNLYYSTTAGVTTASTKVSGVTSPYAHTALTNGTTVYYRASAVNATGEGPLSVEVEGTPLASPISFAAATTASTAVGLSWAAVIGATTYDIYFKTSTGVTTADTKISTAGTTYTHSALTNGTTYYYRIAATKNASSSALAAEISATPLAAPTLTSIVGSTSQNTITWPAVSGALSYNLYFATATGVTTASTKLSAVTSPYVHSALANGTTYYYKIEAVNSSGVGNLSTEFSSLPLAIPTAVAATSQTSQNTLTWTPVTGATSYNLYFKTSAGVTTSDTLITTVTSPYVHSSLTNNTTYYYKIVAVNATGTSTLSSEVSAKPLAVATGVTAISSTAQNTVSWSAVSGALSYNIYYSGATGVTTASTKLAGVTSPYVHSSLTNNAAYFYKVEAVTTSGVSALSAEVTGTPLAIATGLAASSVAASQSTLTWTSVPGAVSYKLYWQTSAGVTAGSSAITGIANSPYTHTALTNATAYYYKVVAVNPSGESSLSSEVTVTPLATATGASVLSATGQNTISWSAVSGATAYNIYWKTSTGVTTADTKIAGATSPYIHSSLTNGTAYFYVIEAVGASSSSGLSAEITGTPLAAPTGVTVASTSGQTTLTWTSVTGATGYSIYFKTTGGVVTTADTQITSATSPYTHSSLTNGTTYDYKIQATTSNGSSNLSSQVTATPVAAPTAGAIVGSNQQNSISWTGATAATGYNIYWGTTTGITTASTKISAATTPYLHTTLTNGQAYFYKISSYSASGESALTAELTSTPLAPPASVVATSTTAQNAISWAAVSGATSYNIYFKTSVGVTTADTKLTSVTSPYSHVSLTNGQIYYYKIEAQNATGVSNLSAEVSATPIASVTGVTAVSSTTQNTISWTAATGATSYNIYFGTATGITTASTKLIGVTSPYAHSALTNNQAYFYKVEAISASGPSNLSSEVTATPLAVPTGFSVAGSTSQNVITWTAVAGAASYKIYWGTSAGITTASTAIASLASAPYTHTALTNNTSYYYKIVAVNTSGESALSAELIGKPLAAPTGLAIVSSTSQNALSWTAVPGATGYFIYWQTTTGVTTASTQIASATTSYTHASLTNGTTYYYKISATVSGSESSLSSEASGLPLAAATGVAAVPGTAKNTISWTAVSGATSYNVYYATTTGVTTASTQIATVTSPYVHSALTNGSAYFYKIQAVNSNGVANLSVEVTGTPIAAPSLTSVVSASTQNTVTFGTVTGAATYNIYFKTSAGVAKTDTKITGVTSPYVHSSLTNGTKVYYVIEAVNAGANVSDLSNEIGATPLDAPVGLIITASSGQNALSWTAVTGATGYTIYWATSTGVTTGSASLTSASGSYIHGSLTNGTTYYYKIAATAGANSASALSAEISATPLAAPTGVTIAVASAKTTISWTAVTGATAYNLYWANTTGVTTASTKIASLTSPFDHNSLTDNTAYFYKVEAVTGTSASALSAEVTGTPISAPTGLTVTTAATQNTVTWTASAGATSYNIFWGTSPGITTASTKITGASSGYVHSSLTNGTAYYYRVQAVNTNNGQSYLSTEVSGTPVVAVAAPTGVASVSSTAQNSISWTAVSGATSYNIYWAKTPGVTTGSTKITGATSAYIHSSLTDGTTYYYKIEAANGGSVSALSTEVSSTPVATPNGLAVSAASTVNTITWTASAGATSYTIYWASSAGVTSASTAITSATSPYSHTGRTNGTMYYYKVSAVNSSGESALTSEVSGGLTTPVLTTFSNRVFPSNYLDQGTALNLDWDNTVTASDANMTYACLFDKVPDGAVNAGSACSSLPGTATFNTATGQLAWTPDVTAWGPYEIKVTGTGLGSLSDSKFVTVDVRQPYDRTNLLGDWDGQFATGSGFNTAGATSWTDLTLSGNTGLATGTFAWPGDGLFSNPYSAQSSGTQRLDFGSATMAGITKFMFSTWISPSAAASTDTLVIGNSGDGAGNGFTLRQSAVSSGKLDFNVGNNKTYQQVVVADSPTSYWRLGEAAGTTATDVQGISNGTYNAGFTLGSAGAITSNAGTSTNFDGATGYVDLTNNAAYQITTGSLEAWIKTSNPGASYRGIFVKSNAFGIFVIGNYLAVYDWGTSSSRTSTFRVDDGIWHHVVVTFQSAVSNGTIIYLDGAPVLTTSIIVPSQSNPLLIGNNTGTSQFINSLIQEAAIYSTVLTPNQITNHYLAGQGTFGCKSTSSFTNNTWNHVAGIFDGTTTSLFVNGQSECSYTSSLQTVTPSTNLIAGATSTGTKPWSGSMADLKIFGTSNGTAAGSATAVKSVFDVTSPRFRSTPPGNISATGLVLNFDAANAQSGLIFPGIGCTSTGWFDLSSSSSNGILSNFAGCNASSGWNGTGLSTDPYRLTFNGTNNYVSSVITSSLVSTATFMGWYNATALESQSLNYPLSLGNGSTPAISLYIGGTYSSSIVAAKSIGLYDGTNAASTVANTFTQALDSGAWHHIAVVYDAGAASKTRIFKDGTEMAMFSNGIVGNLAFQNKTYVGKRADSLFNWNGSIASINNYNVALTPAQISANCKALQARFAGSICN